jgi:hypothetical protein
MRKASLTVAAVAVAAAAWAADPPPPAASAPPEDEFAFPEADPQPRATPRPAPAPAAVPESAPATAAGTEAAPPAATVELPDDEVLPPLPAGARGPSPQRVDPSEKVRADFPVSFPVDI